jgi:hypothetical protein
MNTVLCYTSDCLEWSDFWCGLCICWACLFELYDVFRCAQLALLYFCVAFGASNTSVNPRQLLWSFLASIHEMFYAVLFQLVHCWLRGGGNVRASILMHIGIPLTYCCLSACGGEVCSWELPSQLLEGFFFPPYVWFEVKFLDLWLNVGMISLGIMFSYIQPKSINLKSNQWFQFGYRQPQWRRWHLWAKYHEVTLMV